MRRCAEQHIARVPREKHSCSRRPEGTDSVAHARLKQIDWRRWCQLECARQQWRETDGRPGQAIRQLAENIQNAIIRETRDKNIVAFSGENAFKVQWLTYEENSRPSLIADSSAM